MLENIELKDSDKIKLKTISAQKVMHMKDLLIQEAKVIINDNIDVPRVKRENEAHRVTLIIRVDESFKNDIKNFCEIKSVRIRDFWVECVHRIIKRELNDN